jgi:hypothetical protein
MAELRQLFQWLPSIEIWGRFEIENTGCFNQNMQFIVDACLNGEAPALSLGSDAQSLEALRQPL